MLPVDSIQLNFSPESLSLLNVILALIMFGVALEMRLDDFKQLAKKPYAPFIGMLSQFLILPAATFAVTAALDVPASLSLGLILVAACPGGNVSNFFTHLSGGNTALSVTMSSVSTAACIVMTPLNFTFWASQRESTNALLQSIDLSAGDILLTVLLILVIPTIAGMLTNRQYPSVAAKLAKPFRILSILFLFSFIVLGLKANWQFFVDYISTSFLLVFIVNTAALCIGYSLAKLARLNSPSRKAVTFETGIQNTGFGLILVFNFFGGLGGMAIICAWWGIWHLITGLSLAFLWNKTHR